MKPLIEKRQIATPLDVTENGEGFTLVGYAAKFDSLSEDLGGFRESIAPGAFTRSLESGADVRCLFEHDTSKVLGRRSAGTLRLVEDTVGLRIECDLPRGVSYAEDLAILLKRGDISQMSFGFTVDEGGDEWLPPGKDRLRRRVLRSVKVLETSVVTFPAYTETEAAIRSLAREDANRALLAFNLYKLRRR